MTDQEKRILVMWLSLIVIGFTLDMRLRRLEKIADSKKEVKDVGD